MTERQPDNSSLFLMLWLSMLVTVLAIGGLGAYLVFQETGSISFAAPEVRSYELLGALYLVAIGAFVASRLIPPMLVKNINRRELQQQTQIPPLIRARLMAPYIIRISMLESISILGMLLMVMETDVMVGAPLVAFSIVTLLLSIPSDRLLRRIALGRDDTVTQV